MMRSANMLRLLRCLPGSEWAGLDTPQTVEGVTIQVFFTEAGEVADYYIQPKQHGTRDRVRELTRSAAQV